MSKAASKTKSSAAASVRRAARDPAPDKALIEDLVAANRILAREGVLDGFGHVSVRHDKDPSRYLLSVSRAPELVSEKDIVAFDLDSNPVRPDKRSFYLERFIHGEIYKARPDVQAVVHSHSPSIVPFGVAGVPLQAVYHMAGFLCCGVPVFDIRTRFGMTDMLVRNGEQGRALAEILAGNNVALMRGHGNVVVGPSIPMVVFRAIYTEVNARLQQQVQALGGSPVYLSPEEGEKITATNMGVVGRPWELWKRKALAK